MYEALIIEQRGTADRMLSVLLENARIRKNSQNNVGHCVNVKQKHMQKFSRLTQYVHEI